jgi:hypothetical protein
VKHIKNIFLGCALSIIGSSFALADTPVVFASQPGSQALSIAYKIYGSYISDQPKGGTVQVAMVDLDHNDMAAIAVRFVNSQVCDSDNACHTTILAYESGQWHEVFSHKTISLAVKNGPANLPAQLVSDGHIVWQPVEAPMGDGIAYYPVLGSYTDSPVIAPDQPANSMEVAAANADLFPKGPPKYLKASDYTVAALNVGGVPKTLYEIMDNNFYDCGDAGCPVTIVDENGVSVMDTTSHGLISLSDATTNGVKNIVIASFAGLDTYAWDSENLVYRLKATTYTSKVTPIP